MNLCLKMKTRPKATEEDFRNCGFTAAAINYPLNEAAVRALAHINGLSFEQYINISPAVWYSPNFYCQKQAMERGVAHAEGRLHKNEEGRWVVTIKST